MAFWTKRGAARHGRPGASDYENYSLIDVVVRKTAALPPRIDDVVPGDALLPTIAALYASGGDPLRVLDFGGAAGLHYRLAKEICGKRRFRWAVVETAAMVEAATAFANDELHFFTNLSDGVAWLQQVDLMHCVSALQYVSEPAATLSELLSLRAPTVLWAKLMLGAQEDTFRQVSRLRDNGPGPLPEGIADRKIAYTARRMAKSDFLTAHERADYRLVWKGSETNSFLFAARDRNEAESPPRAGEHR